MTKMGRYQDARRTWMDLYGPMQDGFFIPSNGSETDGGWPANPAGSLPEPVEEAPGKYVLRSLIVDMTDVLACMEKLGAWQELELIADVILFPTVVHDDRYDAFSFGLGFSESQVLRLTARSIEVMDGSALFVSYRRDVVVEICAGDVTGDIKIGFEDENFATFHDVIGPESGGNWTRFDGATNALTALDDLPGGGVAAGDDLYWTLMSSFNVGSVLGHDRRSLAATGNDLSPTGTLSERQVLAADILTWVHRIAATGADPTMHQLSLSSANMAGIVRGQAATISYVPMLKAELYHDLVAQLEDVTTDYETKFDDATKALILSEPVGAYIKATGANFEDRGAVSDQLIADAQQAVQENQRLLDQNAEKVEDITRLEGELDQAILKFHGGIDDYKAKKKSDATFAIAEAAFEVGASLGAMAAGDEAAVAGVEGGVKAVETAAKEASKIKKLIETIKKIAAMISKLKDVLDALKKTKDAVGDFRKIGPEASKLGDGLSRPDVASGEVMDVAYWQVFRETAEDILKPLSEIDGSDDYLTALRHLSIYGTAVTANRQALIAAQQKLLKLSLDAATEKDMAARLETISKDARENSAALQSAKVLLYQDLLRVKGQVLVYMDAHAAAYRYWAVEPDIPKECVPFLSDSAAALKIKLINLSKLRLQKLEQFLPSPEPMHARIHIDDPRVLASLARDRKASFTVTPDNAVFQLEEDPGPGHPAGHYERVRLIGERVYLNPEAVPDKDLVVKIAINTNGHFMDSYRSRGPYAYIADTAEHTFAYRVNDDRDDPISDARAAKGFDYFHPTPFTTWTITIENKAEDLALDKLTGLEFHLFGKWSPVIDEE
ncbi:MAG TPA: hypothetical protein DHC76_20365 [Rhodobacteraceae bacterium]|jgi:hypothetical protein|nr:hypothetical protein RB2083_2158 [Rhodobacteraceae bacterium HTCC2083]HCW86332.1 hypothetical protein [Paracoccaceae bacterium]